MEEYVKRIAIALETIAAPPPEVQEELPIPKCPHCGTLNPTISVEESKGSGPISYFVIRGYCDHCGRIAYAVPELWILHPDYQMAERHLENIKKRMEPN